MLRLKGWKLLVWEKSMSLLIHFIEIFDWLSGLKKWNPRVRLIVVAHSKRSCNFVRAKSISSFGIFTQSIFASSWMLERSSQTFHCSWTFYCAPNTITGWLTMRSSKERPCCFNAKIVAMHAQIIKILAVFILCSTAIREIFYCLQITMLVFQKWYNLWLYNMHKCNIMLHVIW